MSKKQNNYNKIFKSNNEEVKETPSFENASNEEVQTTPETQEQKPQAEVIKFGVVSCERLNVREEATKDSKSIMIVKSGDKLIINVDKSTDDFYKVEVKIGTNVVEGYCMKKFITVA